MAVTRKDVAFKLILWSCVTFHAPPMLREIFAQIMSARTQLTTDIITVFASNESSESRDPYFDSHITPHFEIMNN